MPTVRVSERVEQRHIVAALRAIGARVLTLGTVRAAGDHPGTRQSPGWPDVGAFLPPSRDGRTPPHWLWVEVKAHRGRLRPEQVAFRADCQACGIAHVVGGLDQVLAYLVSHGYVREVAHYRNLSLGGIKPDEVARS